MAYYSEDDRLEQSRLSQEDEIRLMRRWRKRGDVNARNEVIKHHLCLAASLVYSIAGRGKETEVLTSAANYGLMRAAETFDPDRGVRFGSYARPFIRGHILRAIRSRVKHTPVDPTPYEDDGDEAIEETNIQQAPTAMDIDVRMNLERLGESMKTLDRRSRRVIKEVYWEHRGYAEVARRMGLSREWVRKLHDNAMDQLKLHFPA